MRINIVILLSVASAILLTGCHSHDWKEATCTAPPTCKICGYADGEPLGHDSNNPTCTEPAICSRCSEIISDELGHDFSEPTCTEPSTCSRCGKTEGIPTGHHVSNGEITVEATCSTHGEMTGECTQCGKIVSVPTDLADHIVTEVEIVIEPTCVDVGQQRGICQICGEIITTEIPCTKHTVGEWEVETPATYYSSGTRVKKCIYCQKTIATQFYDISEEEKANAYKADCFTYTYEEIARTPEKYIGDDVTFTGEVIQVIENGNSYSFRVNVTSTSYGYTDTIYVTYERKNGEPRILEDDIITVWGPFTGTYSYTAVLGQSITVPSMDAWYLSIN